MNLTMQQRDAILAGLAMLRLAIEQGMVVIDKGNPESDPIGDLLSNGGTHAGLTANELAGLADHVLEAYPGPELAVACANSRAQVRATSPTSQEMIDAFASANRAVAWAEAGGDEPEAGDSRALVAAEANLLAALNATGSL